MTRTLKNSLEKNNMQTKLYNLPIKTFDPKNLMDELLMAKDGDVFVINEENISPNIGGYEPELTMIQVKKVREKKMQETGSAKKFIGEEKV